MNAAQAKSRIEIVVCTDHKVAYACDLHNVAEASAIHAAKTPCTPQNVALCKRKLVSEELYIDVCSLQTDDANHLVKTWASSIVD
jgi:hypothetical protein